MKLMPKNGEGTKWLKDPRNKLMFDLYVAYLNARSGGKRGTYDEHRFEAFEFINLGNLTDSMLEKYYKPTPGTAHVVSNPVGREIFAAKFRDRILHHWAYDLVYDWWNVRFIDNSYSCREEKGTLNGILTLQKQIQDVERIYNERAWIIKLDIQAFFASIDRKLLWECVLDGLNEQFAGNCGLTYEIAKHCLRETILVDPCMGAKRIGWPNAWKKLPKHKCLIYQLPGIGIVIGNLTSQLFSNIFLDALDRYVMEELGYEYYGRYVDDFYFVVPEGMVRQAREDISKIEEFLASKRHLTLHPNKRSVQPADRGVAFLGAVVYPTAIHPGKRLKAHTKTAFYNFMAGRGSVDTLVSYIGHMRYMKHEKFLSELCVKVGLPRDFWKQYESVPSYKKQLLIDDIRAREKMAAEIRRGWKG